MNSVIGEGRTDKEALDKALEKLGAKLDQVKVEVLDETRGAFFGLFGGRKVRVRVTKQGDAAEKLEEVLGGILKRLGIGARVGVRAEKGDYHIEVVTMEADGLLIGKHGETLHAVEHLLNRILHRDRSEQGRVRVDIGGYRERRDDQLRAKAISMARKVKESGRELSTDPLYSPDRRVIHLALTGDPSVRTYTVGDGLYKSVVVAPSSGRGEARSAAGGGRPRGGRPMERRRAR